MRMEYLPRTYSVLSVAAAEKFHTSLRELLPGGRYAPVQFAYDAADARRRLLESRYDITLSARRCAMNSAPILHSTSLSNRARGYCSW